MKKVVKLTEADLINLIKGTINELEHDAEGYAKYVKREDYLNATSILVQNELIDNGLDVYAEEHGHNLGVEGFNESSPDRELNIKLIIIEFETFYDDDYELSSDMTDMKLKIYHIGNNVPTFATYNLLDGIDLLIDLKNKGLLPSTNNEAINESSTFSDRVDELIALSILVEGKLIDNGLDVYVEEHSWHTLIVEGFKEEDPNRELNIDHIIIKFVRNSNFNDGEIMWDMLLQIYYKDTNTGSKMEMDKYSIEDGIDFILKLKEDGELPTIN